MPFLFFPPQTHANGVLGGLGAPAKCPVVEDLSCAGERQEIALVENAVDHGLKQKAAIWDLAQVTSISVSQHPKEAETGTLETAPEGNW